MNKISYQVKIKTPDQSSFILTLDGISYLFFSLIIEEACSTFLMVPHHVRFHIDALANKACRLILVPCGCRPICLDADDNFGYSRSRYLNHDGHRESQILFTISKLEDIFCLFQIQIRCKDSKRLQQFVADSLEIRALSRRPLKDPRWLFEFYLERIFSLTCHSSSRYKYLKIAFCGGLLAF